VTEPSGSLLEVAATAAAAGASSIDAAASDFPDRVDSDLRISSPTNEGTEAPVDRTTGRGASINVFVIAGSFEAVGTVRVCAAAVMPRW
jgi:hypothetical protein